MRFTRRRIPALVAVAAAALFLAMRWPLLHGPGVIEGTNVDTSIIALMGKKMAEGRGFDVFCWGVRHLGPLTSMLTAAWGFPLTAMKVEWAWPLAVRLASMTEVAAGIALLAWAIARIDRRAAAVTALVLAVGPPQLLRTSLYASGHEMSFVLGAAILAIATQHLTAPEGRGWLASPAGRFVLGVVAGIGWWMNKTVAYVLAGVLVVVVLRSELFRRSRSRWRLPDRFLLRTPPGARRLPGLVEATAFVLHWSGLALIAVGVVRALIGLPVLPFILGPLLDGVLLVAVAQLIVALARMQRPVRPLLRSAEESRELRSLAQCAAGFALGYLPAWLANTFDWYPASYATGANIRLAGSLPRELAKHGPYILPGLLGVDASPAGLLYSLALLALAVSLLVRYRKEIAAYLRLTPSSDWGARTLFASILVVTAAATLLMTNAIRARYMLVALGPLFALLTMEALRWWDSRRLAPRAVAGLAVGACLISVTTASILSRERFYNTDAYQPPAVYPDPLIVLGRLDALGCRVTYTNYFQAYDYRLLTDERIAFVPYVGNVDQTPLDTRAFRKLPGLRCYVTTTGSVFPLAGDLELKRRGRVIPTRQWYLASLKR